MTWRRYDNSPTYPNPDDTIHANAKVPMDEVFSGGLLSEQHWT